MTTPTHLTLGILRRKLEHNHRLSGLRWSNISRNYRAGMEAGNIKPDGNVWIKLNGELWLASKLIIWHVTGNKPKHRVIFIDGNKLNLKYDNLQELIPKVSKIPQIIWSAKKQKWRALIRHKGKIINVGWFVTEEGAIEARRERNYHLGFTDNEDHVELRFLKIKFAHFHDELVVTKMGKFADLGDNENTQTIMLKDIPEEFSDKQVLSIIATSINLRQLLLEHEFKFSYNLLKWEY